MPAAIRRLALVGIAGAVVLVAASMIVPAVTGWQVYAVHFPPVNGDWMPRVGWASLAVVVIALLALRYAVDAGQRLGWWALLVASFVAALAWLLALALVDGLDGIGSVLLHTDEYLRTARHLDVRAALQEWVARTSNDAGSNRWTIHVAGHPPGATLFFWLLARTGLGSGLAAGMVVTVVAATTPAGVLITLRTLGAEPAARAAAPFLVFGPAAVWSSVSGDAVFAATTAWAMAALAAACRCGEPRRRFAWSVLAGLLLGTVVMFSYGLPLVAVLALTVVWVARPARPLTVVAMTGGAAALVLTAYAASGFDYLAALGAIRERYWAGIASRRPGLYWVWGNLAALALSAGPIAAAGVTVVVGRARDWLRDTTTRVPAALTLAGVVMVVAADLSQMSRAEVERIWLPFVPWLLVSTSLLPERWRRCGLVAQVATALLVQHLVRTTW